MEFSFSLNLRNSTKIYLVKTLSSSILLSAERNHLITKFSSTLGICLNLFLHHHHILLLELISYIYFISYIIFLPHDPIIFFFLSVTISILSLLKAFFSRVHSSFSND